MPELSPFYANRKSYYLSSIPLFKSHRSGVSCRKKRINGRAMDSLGYGENILAKIGNGRFKREK
ncbi:MAG: hypothetical protein KKH94_11350 [Candidatus Omnitrophica bacterium]|nr:hypothetical protein [Candidatus Omnitrophota bacterium]